MDQKLPVKNDVDFNERLLLIQRLCNQKIIIDQLD